MRDWSPRYNPAQRQAIVAAVLDDHIRVPAVIQLASQGELGDLEPFSVPLSSAYGIVDKERRRRRKNRSAQEQIEALYDEILQRTANELATLTAKPKLTATELNQARALLRLAKELERRPKPTSNGQRQPDATPEVPREPSFIDTLAEQAEARADQDQDSPAETPTRPPGGDDRGYEAPREDPLVWRAEEPSTPNTSPTVTDAQRKAAQALLTAGNGLGSLTS